MDKGELVPDELSSRPYHGQIQGQPDCANG